MKSRLTNRKTAHRPSEVAMFDFFSGCGGTSTGMSEAGVEVMLAVENNRDAAQSFRLNHPAAKVLERDIRTIAPAEIEREVARARSRGQKILFTACAPCQPFSRQRRAASADDPRRDLLLDFLRFVRASRPDFVFCENVPGVRSRNGGEKPAPGDKLIRSLARLGYRHVEGIVDCRDYGVPQKRSRWILIAGMGAAVTWPRRTHGAKRVRPWSAVWDWIADLPPLVAGQADPGDPVHAASNLSALNAERIRATPVGGSRRDWPEHLQLACHAGSASAFTDVYGRLRKDQPASAITTRCISLSNGRFGHPEQHRAISAREAARLQTFPKRYRFAGNIESIAAQIGNAVPVLLARRFGAQFIAAARRES